MSSGFSRVIIALHCLAGSSVLAVDYIPLDVPERSDYVFDRQGVLYITAGPQVIRYDTRTQDYLSPFDIGGRLCGIDLSPDGRTLAIADSAYDSGNNWIHLVDITTGSSQQVNFARERHELGTYMVAWGVDNRVLTTSRGDSWVPLRRYDPVDGITEVIRNVTEYTMLTPSADRQTIGLVQPHISSGPVSRYDVSSGGTTAGKSTNWFTFEVGVSHDGSQFFVPTYSGAFVYEATLTSFVLETKIGDYADYGPLAGVYAPNADVLFVSEWAHYQHDKSGVRVYDTNTWKILDEIDPYNFMWNGNSAMGSGRLEISPNGQWLAVSVSDGTRLYRVAEYTPEPTTPLLLAIGGAILGCRRRRWSKGNR